jgi:hypothetical protein
LEQTNGPFTITAETDGRVHLYDANRRPIGLMEEWGSDLGLACNTLLLAAHNSAAGAEDAVTAYRFSDAHPVESTEPLELPGPVTGLWPAPAGALVAVKNLETGRYAAYSLILDCSH